VIKLAALLRHGSDKFTRITSVDFIELWEEFNLAFVPKRKKSRRVAGRRIQSYNNNCSLPSNYRL